MLNRKKIKDLSATGHPRETARLIIAALKDKKYKSKVHIDHGHVIHIHFNKSKGVVNIDIEEFNTKKTKLIAVCIPYEDAVAQAHALKS